MKRVCHFRYAHCESCCRVRKPVIGCAGRAVGSNKNMVSRGESELHVGYGSRAIIGIVLSTLIVACSGMGETSVGNRPLLYKNVPGDDVETKAGIVRKADNSAEPAPRAATPQP